MPERRPRCFPLFHALSPERDLLIAPECIQLPLLGLHSIPCMEEVEITWEREERNTRRRIPVHRGRRINACDNDRICKILPCFVSLTEEQNVRHSSLIYRKGKPRNLNCRGERDSSQFNEEREYKESNRKSQNGCRSK